MEMKHVHTISIGYTVSSTFTQFIIQKPGACTCGAKTITCIADVTVEWLDPNSEVITTDNQSRIYGM